MGNTLRKFSDLPPEYRMAFHGTKSVFLEKFKKDGVWVISHPTIDKAAKIVRGVYDTPVSPDAFLPKERLPKKGSKNWELYHKNSGRHIFPGLGYHFGTRNENGNVVYITSEFKTALSYSATAPEMGNILFGEIPGDWSNFVATVRKLHGSVFDRELDELEDLRNEYFAEFSKAKPIVLKLVIPELSYIRYKEYDGLSEKDITRRIWEPETFTYHPALCDIYRHIESPLGSSEYHLIKPLEWKHVLAVHYTTNDDLKVKPG